MDVGTARRSPLSSYVRTLQGGRPPAEWEGTETSTWRKVRSQGFPFLAKGRPIVGREHELGSLRDCYDRITKMEATEVVTIHGPSGVGKSALMQTFIRSLPAGAYHMEGHFSQLQSRAPFAALAAASDQFCRQIMRREDRVEVRNRIRAVLGPDVCLLGNLVPTLAKMTTEEGSNGQHTPAACGAQLFTRFKLLFRAFLRCVATPESPIVFFLDDLQWADEPSLEVLRTLLRSGQSHCIMIVCAYREGEMTTAVLEQYSLARTGNSSADEPLNNSSGSSSHHSCGITDISVDCLDCGSLNQLISDRLTIDAFETRSLSAMVWNKTDGNPFHALCFLDMLHRRGMLYEGSDGSWTWDEDQILRGMNVAGNLADILLSRMQDLPEQVRSILQIASFVGHAFPAAALVTIVHEEQDMLDAEYSFEKHSVDVVRERIAAALKMAVAVGLLETMPEAGHFKFAHDKIQEALHEGLMPDEMERQLLHQRIGTLIWDSVRCMLSQTDDWYVFLAADNLNRAVGLVDYSGTRYDLIELNRIAAKRAIKKAAFGAAAEYLRTSVSLLQGDLSSWDDRYELCMDTFTVAAETEKNAGMFSRSSALVNEIHSRATSFHHECAAYAVEMDSLSLEGDPKGAVLLGLKVLRHLGIKFPKNISMFVVTKELLRAKVAQGRRSLPDLLLLPEMEDKTVMLAFDFMNAIALNCYIVGGPLSATYAVICMRMFRLTLQFGISPLYSPAVFFAWGSLHAIMGDFEIALQAETLAFSVVDKYDVESVRAWMVICNYGMNHFWRNTLDSRARREFLDGYRMALTYGHVSIAQTGFFAWVAAAFYLDDSLTELNSTTRHVVQETREFQSKSVLVILLPLWQVVRKVSLHRPI
jgi:predicted ATPase